MRTLALGVVLALFVACGVSRLGSPAPASDEALGACAQGLRSADSREGPPGEALVHDKPGSVAFEATGAAVGDATQSGEATLVLTGLTGLRGTPVAEVRAGMEDVRRAVAAVEGGNRLLAVVQVHQAPSSSRWLVALLAVRPDGRVAVIGSCRTDLTEDVRSFAVPSEFGRTHADVVRAVFRDPRGPAAGALREHLGLSPRQLTLDQLPADRRQITGNPPPSVAGKVTMVAVSWRLPESWRPLRLTFCPHARLALGECMSTGAIDPVRYQTTFVYVEPGQGMDIRIHPEDAGFDVLAPGVEIPAALVEATRRNREGAVRVVGDPAITTREELLRRGTAGPPPFTAELIAKPDWG